MLYTTLKYHQTPWAYILNGIKLRFKMSVQGQLQLTTYPHR